MIRWLAIAAALAMAGCEPTPPFPAGYVGPPSLQLVPADYFSRHLRPGARPEPGSKSKPQAIEKSGEDGTVRVVTPEPAVPPEISERLEKIDAQLQWLRRSITRPPARSKPPSPPQPSEQGEP